MHRWCLWSARRSWRHWLAICVLSLSAVMLPARAAIAADFEVAAAGAVATVLVEPSMPSVGEAALTRWIARAMQALAGYTGGFAVPRVYVAVRVQPGGGVGNGVTFATDPPAINIRVGQHVSQSQLDDDWVLVHEMAHLYLPSQPRRYRWFEEGFAVYVEAMARMHAGFKSRQATLADFEAGLHHGEPLPGEGDIDGTRRWGRVYWGGLAEMRKVERALQRRDGTGWVEVIRSWRENGWDIRSQVPFAKLWPGY